jgi:hypothetical protein
MIELKEKRQTERVERVAEEKYMQNFGGET